MTSVLKKQLKALSVATLLSGAFLWQGDASRAQSGGQSSGTDLPTNPIAAFLSPIFQRARENSKRSACQSNLSQIAVGMLQYTQDYEEKLPPARRWSDVLNPYVKSKAMFTCPSLASAKSNGYSFNSRLSGKDFSAISKPDFTVAFYETSVLKRSAFGMGEFPAFRHLRRQLRLCRWAREMDRENRAGAEFQAEMSQLK